MKLNSYKYIFFILLFLGNICFTQTYRKIKILTISKNDIIKLASIGLPLEESHFIAEENSLELIVNDKELESIEKTGIRFQIIIPDMTKWFIERNRESNHRFNKQNIILPSGFQYGSYAGYPTIDEYVKMIDTIYSMYPQFVKIKESIGKTYEGRDIYLIRISNYSNSNIKRKVLFTGLHHAREGASMTTPLYYMFYILEHYGKDPVISYLLDNRELYFLPMLNPDGYAYNEFTNPDGGGLWRKNRTPYNGDFGVDINRNYSYKWGIDDNGSSSYVWYETYRGPKAFSEAETGAIKKLCESNNFFAAINYHTFGNLIIYPWGYTNKSTNDSVKFQKIAAAIARNNSYLFGLSMATVGYLTNGDSDDWMYGDQSAKNKIFALTLESGIGSDYFWAPIERIIPIAEENIFSNNYMSLISGPYIDSVKTAGNFTIGLGDTTSLTFTFLNSGLASTAYSIAGLTTSDPYIESITSKAELHNIESYKESDSVTFKLTFKRNTPLGYFGNFKIKLDYDGFPFEKEFSLRRGLSKPVEYSSISLSEKNQKLVLSWSTIAEEIHSGFIIERKIGTENYREIGKIPSKVTNGSSYFFEDTPVKSGIYFYRIKTYDGYAEKYSDELTTNFKFFPLRYNLAQNYPNPANPSTNIEFTLPYDTRITLILYNILGEKVLTLVDDYRIAGDYSIPINLSGLSSQVYFYELKTSDFKMIKRMLVLK